MTNKYKDTKVLILGLGLNRGGLGAAKFFAEQGSEVCVTDLKIEEELKEVLDELKKYSNIKYTLGEHKYEDIDWADLIIRNPALKPDNKYLLYALEKGKRVEMDLGIFLEYVDPSQIIGITGTKGKSTTSTLIYEVLSKCHPERSEGYEIISFANAQDDIGGLPRKEVVFAGNIGKSVLDTIPFVDKDTLVILELSSFQLQAFEQHQLSPKWAVITNIYEDHINYHGSMEAYIEAKRAIAKYQKAGDFLFLKKGDEVTNHPEFLEGSKGQITFYSREDLPSNFKPKLPGEHNLDNFAVVYALSQKMTIVPKCAIEVMEDFEGVEFRLQFVKEWQGVRFYNDSAATNPKATVQALQSLPNCILITGGMDKDIAFDEMVEAMGKYAKSVYFIEGTATEKIKYQMSNGKYLMSNEQNTPSFGSEQSSWIELSLISNKIKGEYKNFEDVLEEVKKEAKAGDVVLFSPGATSFNFWQNEFDRGRKFNEAIQKVFR